MMTIKNELRRRPRGANVKATPVLPKLTEAQFTRQVIQLAQVCGWKVAHFRPAQTAKGWRTPVSGDGKGFPDLVLANMKRYPYLLFVELKVPPNKTTPEQDFWIKHLDVVSRVFVWEPSDWEMIEVILKGETP